MEDPLAILLRILHIAAGVFWVGASFTFFLFIEPATKVLGPNVGPFMEQINVKLRFPIVMAVANVVTILSGLILYWRLTDGLSSDVILSPTGLGFGIGGLAAIAASVVGVGMIRPRVERMGAIGAEVGRSGGPPTPGQVEELHGIEARLKTLGLVDLVLLTIAVLLMATARYLG